MAEKRMWVHWYPTEVVLKLSGDETPDEILSFCREELRQRVNEGEWDALPRPRKVTDKPVFWWRRR